MVWTWKSFLRWVKTTSLEYKRSTFLDMFAFLGWLHDLVIFTKECIFTQSVGDGQTGVYLVDGLHELTCVCGQQANVSVRPKQGENKCCGGF